MGRTKRSKNRPGRRGYLIIPAKTGFTGGRHPDIRIAFLQKNKKDIRSTPIIKDHVVEVVIIIINDDYDEDCLGIIYLSNSDM